MANVVEVKHVQFQSESQRELFAKTLKDDIKDALKDRQEYDHKRAIWLKQNEGRVERIDKPASWQSQLDIPTTREVVQAVRARLVNPIIQQDKVMVAQPRKPEFEDFARQVEEFMDYAFDQFDTQRLFMEWIENAIVYGMGILKVPWVHEQKTVMEWVEAQVPTGQMQQLPDGSIVPGMTTQQQEQPRTYDSKLGVIPVLIPPSDFIYPSTSVDKDTAKLLDHKVYLDESTVKSRIRDQEWYPVFEKMQRAAEIDEVTKTREELLGLKPSVDRFEIHEIYTAADINGDGIEEELIITMDYTSGVILRAIENYYHNYKRPFVILWWERRPNSMDGMSLCYILEHLHKAYTAIIDMLLDSGTLAVKGWFVGTTDHQLVDLFKTQQFNMGDFILLNSLPGESTEVFKLGEPPNNLLELAAILERHINILASINLYNQGQEQVDRPTATGQTLLVEEGKQPLFEKLEICRGAISELSIQMLSRYRQFWQNKVEYTKFVDQQFLPGLVQFPPGLIEDKVLVEPKATSAMLSENTRKQEMVALLDRVGASQRVILDLLKVGMEAASQGLPLGMAARRFSQKFD